MDRRFFLGGTVAALALPDISVGSRSSSVDELTLADIAAAFTTGRLTSHRLTTLYIDRIAARNRVGPALCAVLETNPAALAIAADLDRERLAKGPRGPLHGPAAMMHCLKFTRRGPSDVRTSNE